MIVFRYIAILLITIPVSVNGCDICGCSMGTSAALLPQLNNSVLGVRYNTSFFSSIHPSHSAADTPIKRSRDEFHSIELVGRYNLSPRFHLTALLPYKISSQTEGENVFQNNGVGDLILFGQFLTFHPNYCSRKKGKHQLRLGAGIKFPTGGFEKTREGRVLHAHLQNGTGSLDLLFSGIYTLRVAAWGFNTEVAYRLNNPNTNRYRYGNRTRVSTTAFYWWSINNNKLSLLPTAGLLMEHAQSNRDVLKTIPYTGGWGFYASSGLDILIKNVVLGVHVYPSVIEKWGSSLVKRNFMGEVTVVAAF